ncbi:TlpA family protein disulfide reductase [Salinibacterium sp. SYSU T00001]|uniref:TlpA family protein disulfide reductase n=1 Tax=Homoserinimonas sedimenticola TaxID=2986805 RepID=UPI0022365532|nr:TlpA disulfide reductase family protein [Salinibacterium sedimenticola]MCW4384777.1 TlpA family protein disulfide reductase [Salinibacterium sedimenticola]
MRRRGARAAVAFVAVAALSACGPAVDVSQPAAPLAGVDMDGRHHDLAELQGSVVVVSVWASWCGPCREEVQPLSQAEQEWGDDGLVVLGVNFKDHPDAAQRFVEEEGATFPSVVDADGAISIDWGVTGVPQSFLVDREGEIAAVRFGPVTDEWIADVVVPEVQG